MHDLRFVVVVMLCVVSLVMLWVHSVIELYTKINMIFILLKKGLYYITLVSYQFVSNRVVILEQIMVKEIRTSCCCGNTMK